MRLENVKPGDKLAIKRRGAYGMWRATEVERVTATQAVCKCGTRILLRNGGVVGQSAGWSSERAHQMTPEIESQIRRQKAIKWAEESACRALVKLRVEQIEQVRALVEKLTAENAAQWQREQQDKQVSDSAPQQDEGEIPRR